MDALTCECGCTMSLGLNPAVRSITMECKKCGKMNEFKFANPCKLDEIKTECKCGNIIRGKCNVCKQLMCQVCFDTHRDPRCMRTECFTYAPDGMYCSYHKPIV